MTAGAGSLKRRALNTYFGTPTSIGRLTRQQDSNSYNVPLTDSSQDSQIDTELFK